MKNIATNKQFSDLFAITLSTLNKYSEFCKLDLDEEAEISSVNMQLDDVAYMCKVLAEFAVTKNMNDLHSGIMHQDTFVREYFIKTLRYVEDCANYTGYKACI